MAYTRLQDDAESSPLTDHHSDSQGPAGRPRKAHAAPGVWGALQIMERLCTGPSSAIYRARDTVLERDIAVQLFHTDDVAERERLLDEGRTLARIRHPNIVQVIGADEYDGVVGLRMELPEGQSLHAYLDEHGPLAPAEVTLVGRQLCAALGALHHAGLPNRPLDLEHVVREPDRGIRLMGICSDVDPATVAPEVRAGETAGPRADIYALGVLLYRLGTGRFPAPEDSSLPQTLVDCLDEAVADEPTRRFTTPASFARALARADRPPASPLRRIAGIAIILTLAVLVIQQWPSQYRLDSSLYLLAPDGGRTVLAVGDPLRSGDCLALDVTPTVPMYVYVFAEGRQGNALGLFPRPGALAENPLAPDEPHALAAAGNGDSCWRIDDAAAFGRIHILASSELVPEFAQAYFEIPGSAPSDVAALPLIESARELDENADIAIGVTYQAVELEVPAQAD